MNHFLPCPGCARHVQARDALCPFCGETLPMSLRASSAPTTPSRRLGRAATFAFGAAIAASTACGGEMGEDAGARDAGAVTQDAGTPAADAGADPGDSGSIGPLYGGVPDDSGPAPTDAGADAGDDSGTTGPPYGTPPDAGTDAGFDAGGSIGPLYGASPPPAD